MSSPTASASSRWSTASCGSSIILRIVIFPRFFAGELILGVVLVGIGLFSFLNPGGIFAILPIIFGILVLVEGISKLQRALMLRRYGYPRWVAALVLAIAIMVLGVVLVLNPFGALVMTVRVLGAVILVDGLTGLWVSLILKKNF